MSNKIMSPEEVEGYIFLMGGSILSGTPLDEKTLPKDGQMRRADVLNAVEKFKRFIFEHFAKIPDQVSDDFATQEYMRTKLEESIMGPFGQLLEMLGHKLPDQTK